jgi:hypothetical protein
LTRRASLGGLAVAGLIAGHCFAYRLFAQADPHAHHQAAHSHLPYVFAVIAGLLVAAIGSFVDHRVGARSRRTSTTASLLLVAQLSGFVALSVLDRVMGMSGTEIGGRAFWAGLVIQVIAAGLGALVLTVFRKTIEVIDRIIRAERPTGAVSERHLTHPSLTESIASLAMATGGPTFRGPPLDR